MVMTLVTPVNRRASGRLNERRSHGIASQQRLTPRSWKPTRAVRPQNRPTTAVRPTCPGLSLSLLIGRRKRRKYWRFRYRKVGLSETGQGLSRVRGRLRRREDGCEAVVGLDRKSTRLNSSH